MNGGAYRDVVHGKRIAGLDLYRVAAFDLVADLESLGSKDIAVSTVCVQAESDVGGTVRIVLNTYNLSRDSVLVTLEINETVILLVTAADLTCSDAAEGIASAGAALLYDERLHRATLVQVCSSYLDCMSAAGRRRFAFNYCHFSPLTRQRRRTAQGSDPSRG